MDAFEAEEIREMIAAFDIATEAHLVRAEADARKLIAAAKTDAEREAADDALFAAFEARLVAYQ